MCVTESAPEEMNTLEEVLDALLLELPELSARRLVKAWVRLNYHDRFPRELRRPHLIWFGISAVKRITQQFSENQKNLAVVHCNKVLDRLMYHLSRMQLSFTAL